MMYQSLSLLCLFLKVHALLEERTGFFSFSTNGRVFSSSTRYSVSCQNRDGKIQIVEVSYRSNNYVCSRSKCRLTRGYYDGGQIECQNENIIRSKCSGSVNCDLSDAVIIQPANCDYVSREDKPNLLAVSYYCIPNDHSINLCSTLSDQITLYASNRLYISSPSHTRASKCSCHISPHGRMKVTIQPFFQIARTDELTISIPSINYTLPFSSRGGSQLMKAYAVTRTEKVVIGLTTRNARSSSLSVNHVHIAVNDTLPNFPPGDGFLIDISCNGGLTTVVEPLPPLPAVTTETGDNTGSESNTVVIVLAVILSVVLVTVLLIVGFCIWKRREKIRRQQTKFSRSTSNHSAHNNNQSGVAKLQNSTEISSPIGPVLTTDKTRFDQMTSHHYHTLDNQKTYNYTSEKEEPTYNEIDEDSEYRHLCDAEEPHNVKMRIAPDGSRRDPNIEPYLVSYVVDRTSNNLPSPLSQVGKSSEGQSEAIYAEPLEARVNSQYLTGAHYAVSKP